MFYLAFKVKASLIKYNVKNILWKGFLLGPIIAVLLYMPISQLGDYMRFWYCVTCSVIASIGVLKMDL